MNSEEQWHKSIPFGLCWHYLGTVRVRVYKIDSDLQPESSNPDTMIKF